MRISYINLNGRMKKKKTVIEWFRDLLEDYALTLRQRTKVKPSGKTGDSGKQETKGAAGKANDGNHN